jgi:hypothetical protein
MEKFLPALAGEGDRAKRGGRVLKGPKNPSTRLRLVPLPREMAGRI